MTASNVNPNMNEDVDSQIRRVVNMSLRVWYNRNVVGTSETKSSVGTPGIYISINDKIKDIVEFPED